MPTPPLAGVSYTIPELYAHVTAAQHRHDDNAQCQTCHDTRYIPHINGTDSSNPLRVCFHCETVTVHRPLD